MTERLHFHFSLSCIEEGNGSPLQCSCLENPRDGGAWWAANYGVAQSQTQLKRLSNSSSRLRNREGNGTLLQYSCRENPRDGGAWWTAIYGVAQSQTQLKRLSSSSSSFLLGFPGGAGSNELACQCRSSVQFSSVTQSCLTLCNPMDCSTPGLPVRHQLSEFTQTHVL